MSGHEVELFRDLEAVARDADGALDRSHQPSLYDRLDWWHLTLQNIPGIDPLVLRVRSPDATLWLPLSGRSRLKPLGSWYTLAYAPVFTGDPAARGALLLTAARYLRHFAATLMLWPLAGDVAETFAGALRAAGWRVRSGETSANWRADTAQGWNSYWQARPSRLRNTASRKQRADLLQHTLHRHWNADLSDTYEAVLASSWKPPEGAPAFVQAMAEAEARAGTLRLSIAAHEGTAVAVQLWLVENGVATLHKLAHRREQDRLSPGTLLTAWTIRRLIEDDAIVMLDLGTGDDRYKADWADTRLPLLTLEAANPRTSAGLARIARWRAGDLARRTGLA